MSAHVYRLYDAGDVLLYVGMTERPTERILEHHRRSSWFSTVESVKVETFPTRVEAAYHELCAIRDEDPLHNVQHATDEPGAKATLRQLQAKRAQIVAQRDEAHRELDRYEDLIDQLEPLMAHDPAVTLSEALRIRAIERAS